MFNFIKKTFEGLNKTRKNIVNTFSKFHGKSYLNNNEIDELESVLYQSDLSYELVDLIIENFKNKTLLNDETWEDKFYSILINELNVPSLSNEVDNSIILIVGVNGTGKTTTSAKLANYYKNMGNKVFLVGADTYRAAAVEQLRIWSEKLNVRYISNSATNDPASIVYDGINAGIKDNADKIIIDTAGRLHNSVNLMEELKKIHKIALKFDKKIKINVLFPKYKIFFSTGNEFDVNVIENFDDNKNYSNIINLVQFGWKSEAVPMAQVKKSTITRLFERIFN